MIHNVSAALGGAPSFIDGLAEDEPAAIATAASVASAMAARVNGRILRI